MSPFIRFRRIPDKTNAIRIAKICFYEEPTKEIVEQLHGIEAYYPGSNSRMENSSKLKTGWRSSYLILFATVAAVTNMKPNT